MNPDESTQNNVIGGEPNNTQIQNFDKYSGLAENERKMRRRARFAANSQTPEGREYLKKLSGRYLRNRKDGKTLLSNGEEPRDPVSTADLILLLSLAGFLDLGSFLANLIPVVGGAASDLIFTLPGTLIFWFMYKKRGIEVGSPKVASRFFGTTAIEFIPVLNILPSFIAQVLLVVGASKAKKITGIDFK